MVGGGPAGLSAAIRLAHLQQQRGGEPLNIAVLEKGREAGAHCLSGAVLDPSALADLIPDFDAKGAPLDCPVIHDDVLVLTERRHVPTTLHPAAVVESRLPDRVDQQPRQVVGRPGREHRRQSVHGFLGVRGALRR